MFWFHPNIMTVMCVIFLKKLYIFQKIIMDLKSRGSVFGWKKLHHEDEKTSVATCTN